MNTTHQDDKKDKTSWGEIIIEPPKKVIPAVNLGGMKPIHPSLPQVPIFMAINGPRNRGKSVLCFNLVSKKLGMYGDAFKPNNIFVWSPTAHMDKTYDELELKNHLGPEQISVGDLLNQILAAQKKHLENNNLSGVFILFDDITEVKDAWKFIETFGYTGRHYGIQGGFVAHKLSSVPRGVRTATQQWIIFQPHEQSEMEWIIESFSRRTTKEIWTIACLRAWSIDYNFVHIDFSQKEFERVYRSGFNEPLFTWEEQQQLDIKCLMQNPHPFSDPKHVEPKQWMKEWREHRKESRSRQRSRGKRNRSSTPEKLHQ